MRTEKHRQPETRRRSTRQRELIRKVVQVSKSHPSAEEVFRITRKSITSISLATVYRNLKLLVEDCSIREVQFHGDVTRYDGMLEPHEHFYCRSCGAVVDLMPTLTSPAFTAVEKQLRGKIEQYSLDYYGLCQKCK